MVLSFNLQLKEDYSNKFTVKLQEEEKLYSRFGIQTVYNQRSTPGTLPRFVPCSGGNYSSLERALCCGTAPYKESFGSRRLLGFVVA